MLGGFVCLSYAQTYFKKWKLVTIATAGEITFSVFDCSQPFANVCEQIPLMLR